MRTHGVQHPGDPDDEQDRPNNQRQQSSHTSHKVTPRRPAMLM